MKKSNNHAKKKPMPKRQWLNGTFDEYRTVHTKWGKRKRIAVKDLKDGDGIVQIREIMFKKKKSMRKVGVLFPGDAMGIELAVTKDGQLLVRSIANFGPCPGAFPEGKKTWTQMAKQEMAYQGTIMEKRRPNGSPWWIMELRDVECMDNGRYVADVATIKICNADKLDVKDRIEFKATFSVNATGCLEHTEIAREFIVQSKPRKVQG